LTRGLRLATLWLPVVAYGALVFYLSSLSHVRVAKAIPDYLEHAIEYLGLTVLTIRALNEGLVLPIPGVLHFSALGLGMLYALSDEIHQIWVPRRTASLKDFLSDALGGVLAVGLAELIQRARRVRPDRPPLTVTLYTRPNCHLCHEARDLLRALAEEIPLSLSEVNVESDPALNQRYGSELPVIFAEGIKVSGFAPDGKALRRRLSRVASRSTPAVAGSDGIG